MQLLLLAAEGSSGSSQLAEAFKQNPTFMVLNMIASAIVLTIVIERLAFQLTKYRVNSKEFFAQVKKLVAAGNIDRAIKLCEASDYPILQLVKAGLTHANKGGDEIDAASSEKLSELKPQAEKRMLSNGIAEAMYNTALGLGIALFCMITHIILHSRAKAIQHDLETTVERTFNMLTISQRPGQY